MSDPNGQIPGLCLTPDPKLKPGETQVFPHEFLEDRAQGLNPRAAVAVGNLWDPGSTIRVAFLDSDPFYHQKVQTHLKEWTDAINIHFEFVPANDPSSDVRVTFGFHYQYFSPVGRDAHDRVKGNGSYTMSLGFDPQHTEDQFNYYTLHEFGHVLGLIHEHQSPGETIDWNERAVIDYYLRTNPAWNEQTVRTNILTKLNYGTQVQNFTAFDPDSVMLYPIPEGLASNITRPGFNYHLSASDRRFCQMLYPFQETGLTVGTGTPAEIKTDGQQDAYRFVVPGGGGNYTAAVKSDFPVSVTLFGPEVRSIFVAENHDEQQGGAQVSRRLNPGTYFLKVQQFVVGKLGKYTITVTA